MHAVRQRYLQFLAIELDDLADDLQLMVDHALEAMARRGDAPPVLRENLAIFRNELDGVSDMRAIVANIKPEAYADLDAMIRQLREAVHARVQHADLVPALEALVLRRIEKVRDYVSPP